MLFIIDQGEEKNITKMKGKIIVGRAEVTKWEGRVFKGKNGLSRFLAKLQVLCR